MYDVALYGHLTVDRIIPDNKTSLGSMANVWHSLLRINPFINIYCSPTNIGEALIYVDRISVKRYSKPNLNLKILDPVIENATVSHVLYLNRLSNLSYLDKLDGIVTADVCSGGKLDLNILKHIDILFMSLGDYDTNELIKYMDGIIIAHDERRSVKITSYDAVEHLVPVYHKNINVLGAGDMFASHIINNIVHYPSEINEKIDSWIDLAHEYTSEALVNEKI